MHRKVRIYLPILIVLLLAGCRRHSGSEYALEHEDKDAKEMMQGIWVNDDEGNLSFLVRGDSIFFPDTTSVPMKFWIYKDSIYVKGNDINRYKILTQAPHILKFSNQAGDEVRLVRSDEEAALTKYFFQPRPYAMNIFRTINRDTIGEGGGKKYACSIRIEPTSERVVKSSINDDGIEVDNIYLDNVAKVSIATDGKQIYAHSFRKAEFSKYVPQEFMAHSILCDVQYNNADTSAVYLDAIIGYPDASTSYVVGLKISKNGKLTTNLR